MSDFVNCVFVSDTVGNITVYDVKNGTVIMVYKTGVLNKKCMCLLNNDFIFAAEKGPLVQVWPINSRERLQSIRMVCPGVISAMTTSPDCCYLAVAIEEKLIIWHISTGKLLRTVCRHYQPITVLRWCTDGSYVITGGDDGIVCAWKFSQLATGNCNLYGPSAVNSANKIHSDTIEPVFTFNDHSIKITDLYVGNGGCRARLFTASMDKTCKIYDLGTGQQLLSVVFEERLTAITVDLTEINVFVGTGNGIIKTFSLLDPPRMRDYHYKQLTKNIPFVGHSKMISYMQCTTDGDTLVSSSDDETIKIWHIFSKQCLRTIQLKGSVTNMIVQIFPKKVLSRDFKSQIILKNFEKRYAENNENTLEIITSNDLFLDPSLDRIDDFMEDNENADAVELRNELNKAKLINDKLYEFALENVLKLNSDCNENQESNVASVKVTKNSNPRKNFNKSNAEKFKNKKKRKKKSKRSFIVINQDNDNN